MRLFVCLCLRLCANLGEKDVLSNQTDDPSARQMSVLRIRKGSCCTPGSRHASPLGGEWSERVVYVRFLQLSGFARLSLGRVEQQTDRQEKKEGVNRRGKQTVGRKEPGR